MDVPLEVRFHDLDSSEAAETLIRQRVARLEKLYPRLITCRVTIAKPHRAQRPGTGFDVRIDLSVPGSELVVSNASQHATQNYRDPGLPEVIDEAFDAAERQLLQYKEKRQDSRVA